MKVVATAAALLLAGTAQAQTPPTPTPAPQTAPIPPVGALTRDLNSGPPAPAVYLAPAPRPVIAPAPTSPPAAAAITPAPRPATTAGPSNSAPAAAPPARVVPAPTLPPSEPPVVAPTPAPPPAPAVTVLDSAARAALPFTADLPAGFEIVTGRPGPDFRIYTIRRGPQSFVMVYAGPASQFPIYSGQMVEAAGRASILSTEEGMRHAVEHLFQRSTAPNEIHVWTMSLDGADRDMAEQIAQSVDVR